MTALTKQSTEQLLAVVMQDNDAEAATVGEYLYKLLRDVWREEEGFDGKRPFGNSSWKGEIYQALGKVGLIHATFDAEGWLEDYDDAEADRLIYAAIASLFGIEGDA